MERTWRSHIFSDVFVDFHKIETILIDIFNFHDQFFNLLIHFLEENGNLISNFMIISQKSKNITTLFMMIC